MFGFLFNSKKNPDQSSKTTPTSETVVQQEALFRIESASAPDIEEIDQKFMGLMLGINSLVHEPMNPFEDKLLRRLQLWTEKPEALDREIPRLPSVIPKIMRAVRDETTTAQDLADLIAQDVSLVGEVIRLSNSAFYRTGEKIESLKQAIVKLGLLGIQQLISSAAFKPILISGDSHFAKTLSQYLWSKNQKAAMAGNLIAMHTDENRFHAFLIGLLNQVGILMVIKPLEQHFNGADIPRSAAFMQEIDLLGKHLSVQISQQWEMPDEVIQALQELAAAQSLSQLSPMASAGYVADKLAKMSTLETHGLLHDMDQGIECKVHRISSSLCNQSYNLINLDEV